MEPVDVLVIGSLNRDVVVETEAFPAPGETVRGASVRSGVGGKGANQAVAAALSGARTALVGRVGDDEAGRGGRAALAHRRVGVELLATVADVETGTAVVTVTPRDNTIVVVAGANDAWSADWPAADGVVRTALQQARVTVCQLEVPVAVVVAAARLAGGVFVLNAAPAGPLPDALLDRCDVLVVNEGELAVVSGVAIGSEDDVEVAHGRLRERGVRTVVTTRGAAGAVVSDERGTVRVDAPAADVVDTTGAGDAFTGVLCARLAGGSDVREASRWAAAAGSWTVRSPGTHDAFPDADRLARLLIPSHPRDLR